MSIQSDIQKKPIVVIVVEDEPMVRMAAVAAFEDAGFEVLEGKNAQAAMLIVKTEGGRVHALFTDVEMPGAMDGLMLAQQIHRDWPLISVMVASGRVSPGAAEMPGAMDGLMLAQQIHRDWPLISVMVASGRVSPGAAEMPENSRFFKKPYDLECVVAHIRERALAL